LALAQKVIERITAAGLPADLIPGAITSVTVSADSDAENALRSAVLEFMDTVRGVEHSIAAGRRGEDVPEELDVASLGDISEEEWRAYWPPVAVAEEVPAEDTEPAPEEAFEATEDEPAEEADAEDAEPTDYGDSEDVAPSAEKSTA
jgi:XTP/dITP diphosphohydrolase